MKFYSGRGSRALLASASVLALFALSPTATFAQDSEAGAPGQALTAGSVTTATGSIFDQGPNAGVSVSSGANDTVVVTGAVINNSQPASNGVSIGSISGAPGALGVTLVGGDITATGSAVNVYSAGEDITLDLSTGGGLFTSSAGGGLTVASSGADVTVLNGANTINAQVTGLFAAANGAGGSVTIESTGGTIVAGSFGIAGQGRFGGSGGNVMIGQGAGVSTAISTTAPTGVGILATTSGAGAIAVTTVAGGTINGGQTGIIADASGNGAVSVTVGAGIGQSTLVSSGGVSAQSVGGTVTVDATARISAGSGNTIWAATTGGSGDVSVSSIGLSSASGTAVAAQVFGAGTGDVSYVLNGANTVQGATGVFLSNAGSGSISLTAADAGSSIIGTTSRAVDLRATGGGALAINLAGATTGGTNGGIYAAASGGSGAVVINTAAVNASAGQRAIDVVTSGGPVTVNAGGAILGATNGISVVSTGAGAITVHTASTVQSGTATAITVNTSGAGAVSIGTAGQRLGGAVTGGTTGIFAAGAGDVSVYAGQVTGGTRGIVAANQGVGANGSVIIDVAGPVLGVSSFGIIGVNNGLLSSNTLTINAGGSVTSTGGSAISAQSVAGDITINAAGPVSASSGPNGTWDGIFAEAEGDAQISITAASSVSGTYNGIDAITAGSGARGSIDITAGGAVSAVTGVGVLAASTGAPITITTLNTVSGNVAGIKATSTGGAGAIDINTSGLVTSVNGAGVFASGGGAVTIDTGAVTAHGGTVAAVVANLVSGVTSANGYGVIGLSSGGPVSITTTGLITGGVGGGVLGQTTAGTGAITVNTAAVDATLGVRGIDVSATGGNVSINAGGAIIGGGTGIGGATSGAGTVTIHTSSTVRGVSFSGIVAANTGNGAISVGTAAERLGGAVTGGTNGIFATGAGDVSVYAGQVTAGTRGIVASSQGAGANGRVVIDVTGPVVGQTAFGIIGVNNGLLAANTIAITTANAVTSTGGSGISAQSQGGDITINAASVTANTGPNGTWDGIFADGRKDSLITINTSGAVSGTFNGIDAYSLGDTARAGVVINAGGDVTGGASRSAILATVAGQGDIAINTAAGRLLAAVNGNGISAIATAATGANAISINNQSAIGGAGAAQVHNGILAQIAAGNAGAISIQSTGGAIQATGAGIYAATLGSGSVNIGGLAGIGSAITTAGTGIYGSTVSGALTITTAASGTIAAGATTGIIAHSVSGPITITQAGAMGATGVGNTVGTGIYAFLESGTAAITINSTGAIYVTPGSGLQSAGIYAVHGGTGAISVTSTGVIDPGAYGVAIQGGGDVSYTASGGAVEGDIGAYIGSTGTGTVSLTTADGVSITGFTGLGVAVESAGGNLEVDLGGDVIGATDGLSLVTSGLGGVSLVLDGDVTGQTGAGVSALGGDGLTSLVINGDVAGASTGVIAVSTGAGSTQVTTNGDVFGGASAGLTVVSGTGGLVLNVNGDVISAFGPAINATSDGGGVINIADDTVIAGLITSPDQAVINLATVSGSVSTINVGDGAVVQSASGSVFDVAVRATGGSVVIHNEGVISGRIDFSALTGANTGQLDNAPGTTFLTGGLSIFGAGDDDFVNAGEMATLGALTTFNFQGGTNLFTNAGALFVGFNPVRPDGSSFVLTGLTRFGNSGTLQMMNGVVGDSIVAAGAAYTGSGAARLSIDALLGAPGSRSDTLKVGSTTGRTRVLVNDTSTAPGAYNPAGILVVDASGAGATSAADFALDPGSDGWRADRNSADGVLDKGLFFYDLTLNANKQHILAGLPDSEAFEFTVLGAAAQSVWSQAAGAGRDRQADLRDQIDSGVAADGAGVWVKIAGGAADRDQTSGYRLLGVTYGFDSGYAQNSVSLLAGVDMVSGSGRWVLGGSGGYVETDLDFKASDTAASMQGYTLGLYASYVAGGFFLDGVVTGAAMDIVHQAPSLASGPNSVFDGAVETVGGQVETGYRIALGGKAFLEPVAGVSYARSRLDDMAAPGAVVDWNDQTSLRGNIGARLGGETQFAAVSARFVLTARAWNEFEGENDLTLHSAGPDVTLGDDVSGSFGEVDGTLNLSGPGEVFSAFVSAGVTFKTDYQSTDASLGFRWRW